MLISNSCNTSCCKFFCGCSGIITSVLHKSDRLEYSLLILAAAPANPCASEVQQQKDVFTVSVSFHSQSLCSPPGTWSKKGRGWGECGSLGVSQCMHGVVGADCFQQRYHWPARFIAVQADKFWSEAKYRRKVIY